MNVVCCLLIVGVKRVLCVFSLLDVRCSLFVVRWLLCDVCTWLFGMRCVLVFVGCQLLADLQRLFVGCRLSIGVCRLSFDASFLICVRCWLLFGV